jgi:hypothetical protein
MFRLFRKSQVRNIKKALEGARIVRMALEGFELLGGLGKFYKALDRLRKTARLRNV